MKRYDNTYCERSGGIKKIVLGLVVVKVGVLLLLKNLGYLPDHISDVVFSWQMLLIAIGFINLFGRNSMFTGFVLITIGAFFILPDICAVPLHFTQVFWPVIFILAGLMIIVRWNKRVKYSEKWHQRFHERYCQPPTPENASGDVVDEVNIFGGTKRQLSIQNFKGGKITCVFGGAELDLSKCTLAEGINILDVDCVFGGVALTIPPDWDVRIEVASIMGGFADKRVINYDNNYNNSRQLLIKGATVFGGGAIKSN